MGEPFRVRAMALMQARIEGVVEYRVVRLHHIRQLFTEHLVVVRAHRFDFLSNLPSDSPSLLEHEPLHLDPTVLFGVRPERLLPAATDHVEA